MLSPGLASGDQGGNETIVVGRRPPPLEADLPLSQTSAQLPDAQSASQEAALAGVLDAIPGVLVQDRENPAQGLRLDVRGFGTRAAFGVRGLKILLDGIPLTLPDGQTSLDGLEAQRIERVEVLRGPAAVLYGNSAGGVIRLSSAPPPGPSSLCLRLSDHGQLGLDARTGVSLGRWALSIGGARRQEDGFRQHGHAISNDLLATLAAQHGPRTHTRLILALNDAPVLEDPGALTADEMRADRHQAAPDNLLYDAREHFRQVRMGVLTEGELDRWQEVEMATYAVRRRFGASQSHRIIDLDRTMVGGRLQYRWTRPLGGTRQELLLSLDLQQQEDDRRNHTSQGGGVAGPLELDQEEHVMGVGAAARELVSPWPWLVLLAGGRYDRSAFSLSDQLIDDGDQSGTRSFGSASWLFGTSVGISPREQIFANAGSSFETPTSTELVNPQGGGLNPDLQPQLARSCELGLRGSVAESLQHQLSIYRIDLRDELVRFEDDTRRVFYRNAGRSHRLGFEAGWAFQRRGFAIRTSYTYLQARFDSYQKNGVDLAGKAVAGVFPHRVAVLAQYQGAHLRARLDFRLLSPGFADDENQARTPTALVVNAGVGYARVLHGVTLGLWAGLSNLLGWRYVDNVRANAAGGRFFEPAPGMGGSLVLRLAWDANPLAGTGAPLEDAPEHAN